MLKISFVLVRLLLIIVALCGGILSFAQGNDSNSSAGVMRSNDKIYVVMAVCLTILAGLIFYAIRIDSKIKKLEKEN